MLEGSGMAAAGIPIIPGGSTAAGAELHRRAPCVGAGTPAGTGAPAAAATEGAAEPAPAAPAAVGATGAPPAATGIAPGAPAGGIMPGGMPGIPGNANGMPGIMGGMPGTGGRMPPGGGIMDGSACSHAAYSFCTMLTCSEVRCMGLERQSHAEHVLIEKNQTLCRGFLSQAIYTDPELNQDVCKQP